MLHSVLSQFSVIQADDAVIAEHSQLRERVNRVGGRDNQRKRSSGRIRSRSVGHPKQAAPLCVSAAASFFYLDLAVFGSQ